MDFPDAIACGCAPLQAATVDPFLNGDVRFRFVLQVALVGILAVVVLERALDIDGMSIVPFDQVAVVTVHRPHQISKRGQQTLWQAAPKSGRLLRQIEGEVREPAAVARVFTDQQRLHQRDQFVQIFCRYHVRFNVLIKDDIYIIYIIDLNNYIGF